VCNNFQNQISRLKISVRRTGDHSVYIIYRGSVVGCTRGRKTIFRRRRRRRRRTINAGRAVVSLEIGTHIICQACKARNFFIIGKYWLASFLLGVTLTHFTHHSFNNHPNCQEKNIYLLKYFNLTTC